MDRDEGQPVARTSRILGQRDRAEAEGERIDEQQLARAVLAERDELAHRLDRGEAADHAGQRAEHALVRAADVRPVGIAADEAAIAGFSGIPPAIHGELALELSDRRRDQRHACRQRRVGDDQPRREIVAAVDHHVDALEQPRDVAAIQPPVDRQQLHVGVHPLDEVRRRHDLARAHVARREQRLALEVGERDDVVVDHGPAGRRPLPPDIGSPASRSRPRR